MTTAVQTKVEVGKVEGYVVQFDQNTCEFNALDKNKNVVASAGSKKYLATKLKKKQFNTRKEEKLKGLKMAQVGYHGFANIYTLTGNIKTVKHRWRSNQSHSLECITKDGKTVWVDRLYGWSIADEKVIHEISTLTQESRKLNEKINRLRMKLKDIKPILKEKAPSLKIG